MAVLVDQGRTQTWLARRLGVNAEHLNRVLKGHVRAMPAFRAACARWLGMPESELFLAGGDVDHGASGAPKRRVSREGSAVREVYARSMTASSDAAGGAVA